jgi:flagellar motor switch protein FliN
MKTYGECWIAAAAALFSQALAGEPELIEAPSKPLAENWFGFAYTLTGDDRGRFAVVLDGSVLESPLAGEGIDQKAVWSELLREVADSAAGELLATTGRKCRVANFEPVVKQSDFSRAFQLRSAGRAWTILIKDEVLAEGPSAKPGAESLRSPVQADAHGPERGYSQGIELLLDVELEAALRFGCREMPLGELLELGPGDVVQLDRHVADPVDLIVGDKIVARGEVVLINGNFGLRVTEVAAPKKRLESIRCLF